MNPNLRYVRTQLTLAKACALAERREPMLDCISRAWGGLDSADCDWDAMEEMLVTLQKQAKEIARHVFEE